MFPFQPILLDPLRTHRRNRQIQREILQLKPSCNGPFICLVWSPLPAIEPDLEWIYFQDLLMAFTSSVKAAFLIPEAGHASYPSLSSLGLLICVMENESLNDFDSALPHKNEFQLRIFIKPIIMSNLFFLFTTDRDSGT